MFRLRPANMDDGDFLLELKNDPVMRQFAVVTHDKIDKKDHYKWLDNNLSTIQIIVVDGVNAGMVRLTADREISINVHPSFRGAGVATKAMKKCPSYVWAKIVDGNVPSMRLFLKNGFDIVDHKDNYYVLRNY